MPFDVGNVWASVGLARLDGERRHVGDVFFSLGEPRELTNRVSLVLEGYDGRLPWLREPPVHIVRELGLGDAIDGDVAEAARQF